MANGGRPSTPADLPLNLLPKRKGLLMGGGEAWDYKTTADRRTFDCLNLYRRHIERLLFGPS